MPVIAPTQKQLDNLKKGAPYRFTKENASEMGKRGNEASQAAHEKNVQMSVIAKTVSNTRVSQDKIKKELGDLGITDEQKVNAARIVKAVFDAAVAGNILAVDKWEDFLEKAAAEYAGALTEETRRALALVHQNYLP